MVIVVIAEVDTEVVALGDPVARLINIETAAVGVSTMPAHIHATNMMFTH